MTRTLRPTPTYYASRRWQAAYKRVTCPQCYGFGRLDEKTLCPKCNGEGTIIEKCSHTLDKPYTA